MQEYSGVTQLNSVELLHVCSFMKKETVPALPDKLLHAAALLGCSGFACFFNLAWASACGAGEKGNPAASDEALADRSATVHLSMLSAALPSR